MDVHTGVLTTVPAQWLRIRIAGLLAVDSRLHLAIAPDRKSRGE